MDVNTLYCALCCKTTNSQSYDLKATKSLHSQTPLITLLDKVEKILLLLFDICEECYQLLNELDALNVRSTEICTILRKYISKDYKLESLRSNIECQNLNNHNNVINYESKQISKQESTMLNSVIDTMKNEVLADVWEETEQRNNEKSKILEVIAPNNTVKLDLKFDYPEHNFGPTDTINMDITSLHLTAETCHCGATFQTTKDLNCHLLSHSQNTPFICEICGQGYKQKSQFNIHMDMHNGTNPFVCVYCKKSFTQKIGLTRHVAKHTGEKPYQCEECGKTFSYHTSFNAHKQSHNGIKNFKCSFCGLELMSRSHLKRHFRIHTGERRFACQTCGKCFAERYNLIAHEKIHSYPKSDCPTKRKLK